MNIFKNINRLFIFFIKIVHFSCNIRNLYFERSPLKLDSYHFSARVHSHNSSLGQGRTLLRLSDSIPRKLDADIDAGDGCQLNWPADGNGITFCLAVAIASLYCRATGPQLMAMGTGQWAP